jgi:hypothetical protein
MLNIIRWLTRQIITPDPHEARERTACNIQRIRDQQRAVLEMNLAIKREREIQRSRWPSLERIYAEIERAS